MHMHRQLFSMKIILYLASLDNGMHVERERQAILPDLSH